MLFRKIFHGKIFRSKVENLVLFLYLVLIWNLPVDGAGENLHCVLKTQFSVFGTDLESV